MAKMSGSAMLMMAIFIGAIVTVVFLAAIADQIDVGTSTYTETNGSYTFPAAGSDLVLEGKRNLSAIIMVNATGNVTPIGEDEFNQTTVDDGDAIALTITGNGGPHAGATVNVTYDIAGTEPILKAPRSSCWAIKQRFSFVPSTGSVTTAVTLKNTTAPTGFKPASLCPTLSIFATYPSSAVSLAFKNICVFTVPLSL